MTRKRSPNGIPNGDVLRYYQRRGEGGVGLIFSEGAFIDHPSAQAHERKAYENIPHFYGAPALRSWEKIVRAVHATGAKFIPQLWHVGEIRRLGMPPDESVPGLGPRQIRLNNKVLVKAMDVMDMELIAESYARAAAAAREMGCDGIALHAAHGYLIDQFFWSRTNTRSDEFGGPMENRCRFACRIVETVRRQVGPDFPIVFRFSQWKMSDYAAQIASTPDELDILLSSLVAAGVDIFDVSARRFWEPVYRNSPDSLAAWTRRLSGKPTIAVGSVGLDQPHHSKLFRDKVKIDANVTDLDQVLEAFSRGDFDLVSVARAILADPDWARKVRAGNMASIRPFVRADLETYR